MWSKETGKKRVLGYMMTHGSITSLEAINSYSVTRLSSVIFDLINRDDYLIEKEHNVKVKNKFGEDCRVTRYHYKGRK
tara:strand:- start:423 stop:656 length:234 start_codon:yes stop_codon:yes gene_type:complete